MSNERLAATGFVFQYPDTMTGLSETIRWYESTDWQGFRRGEAPLIPLLAG